MGACLEEYNCNRFNRRWNVDGAAHVVTGTVEDLKRLIQEGATFSTQNPAVPTSYKTAFER